MFKERKKIHSEGSWTDNSSLERVESYKLLGLTMQNNLKWDLHVSEIVTKASKRIHILRVLRRNGVS